MIAVLLPLMFAAASPAAQPAIFGVWHNPKNSVAVRTGACGDKLCGWIVRASDKARNDAAAKGAPPLIGTALLRGYKPSGRGRWSGQVWIPDMGRAFGSTITMVDANTLNVKGCLIGGLICKSQLWRRE
ncbi:MULTISPECIES: DUF2147 domain-containing protein [unclassified Sphingomonas]|uniref:DUF2147 domain-containing protein n=1 Tax=unclassified Sphingomonas TaxID=196159 RepID=UPI00226A2824|nr:MULTISPECIES: DUF2147 domain-containing protein [unclassified Sphingomonas]